jgi:enoyl-CoA hydratase
MVNRVVPLDELESQTLSLAHRIARQDGWALRMAKRAVNRALDAQGFSDAIEAGFDMHHLGHTRALVVTGDTPALTGLSGMKERTLNEDVKPPCW